MAEVMNTWEAIREGANDVERLIGQKQYNLAMIKARQTLEIMVRTLSERNGIQVTDMATAIDELYRRRIISQATAEHYDKIRKIGNKAAHEGDENPSGANAAYHLLSQELYTFAKDFAPSSSRRSSSYSSSRSSSSSMGSRSDNGSGGSSGSRSGYGSGSSRGNGSDYGNDSGYGNSGSRSGSSSRSGSGSGSGNGYGSGNSGSSYSGSRSSSSRNRDIDQHNVQRASHRTSKKSTVTPELIFKIMIPVLALLLILGIVKLVKNSSEKEVVTEPELQIAVETTAPETMPPTTEAPTEPETVTIYTVIPEVLNVRSQPTKDSEKLGQVHQGETLQFISDYDSEWAMINFNDQEGYVNKQYVDVQSMELEAYEALSEAAEGEGGAEEVPAE